MNGKLIEQFLDKDSLKALENLIANDKDSDVTAAAVQLASVFGSGEQFAAIINETQAAAKLVNSFQNNLILLIQKTWVEKSDELLKAEVLNQLEDFCSLIKQKKYTETYTSFFEILNKVVYLMFGAQTKSKDFEEYALRIDPEFGIFWWYIKSLPEQTTWSDSKNRTAVLLGMYFLANY